MGPRVTAYFARVTTVDGWLHELEQLNQVVCLTAAENETVRRVEDGIAGPGKYGRAGITFVDPTPWDDADTAPSRTEPLAGT
jgi:hypothetical protein